MTLSLANEVVSEFCKFVNLEVKTSKPQQSGLKQAVLGIDALSSIRLHRFFLWSLNQIQ